MDHIETLRRLAISDERILDKLACAAPDDGDALEPDGALDPRTLALVRLAALAAVGGAVPSYGAQAHAAVDACASAAEMVDVLIAVLPVVGIPCVVAAAPKRHWRWGTTPMTPWNSSSKPSTSVPRHRGFLPVNSDSRRAARSRSTAARRLRVRRRPTSDRSR